MRGGVFGAALLALALTGCADEAAEQTAKASPRIAASAALSEGARWWGRDSPGASARWQRTGSVPVAGWQTL
ncbi:hypothetical protein NMD75_09675 [Edwardsiella tarda]